VPNHATNRGEAISFVSCFGLVKDRAWGSSLAINIRLVGKIALFAVLLKCVSHSLKQTLTFRGIGYLALGEGLGLQVGASKSPQAIRMRGLYLTVSIDHFADKCESVPAELSKDCL
jgi:hypothetical protein